MSGIGIMQDRPPLVRFDYEEIGTDAEASERAGCPVPQVVPVVKIVQHGDKYSEFSKPAVDWLKQIRTMAVEGRYNAEWVKRFEMQYEEWQKGNEIPRDGIPVKTWHAINREQCLRLIAIGITTVDDLATYPDSGLSQIGLDGRYLRDLAANFIKAAKSGVDTKRLTDLEQTNREQAELIQSMSDRLAALEPKKKVA